MGNRANTEVELYVDSPLIARIVCEYSDTVQELLSLAQYENGATVSFTLYDTDEAAKLIDSLSCPYLTGSNGIYGAVSAANPAVVKGLEYKWEFKIVTASGTQYVRAYVVAEDNPGS